MVLRDELVKFLEDFLEIKKFDNDNSYNGLQVEGREY